MISRVLLAAVILAAMCLPIGIAAAQGTDTPCYFQGNTYIDGVRLTGTVTATIEGDVYSALSGVQGHDYWVKINPLTYGATYAPGTPVTFTVNGYGVQRTESMTYQPGDTITLDLRVWTMATPTPTPGPTPTPSPTATPAPTPSLTATPEPTPTPSPTPEPTPTPTPPGVPTSNPIDISMYVDEDGRVQQRLDLLSADERVELRVEANSTALTDDNEPLSVIQIDSAGATPELPERASVVGQIYDLLPNGASFSPAATIKITYDPESIPEDVNAEDLKMAYVDRVTDEWVELESDVHTGVLKVEAQADHFTAFTILATSPAPGLNTWSVLGPILFVAFIVLFTLVLVMYY